MWLVCIYFLWKMQRVPVSFRSEKILFIFSTIRNLTLSSGADDEIKVIYSRRVDRATWFVGINGAHNMKRTRKATHLISLELRKWNNLRPTMML